MPAECRARRNASAWLLPTTGPARTTRFAATCAASTDDDEVDLAIVGCGAGGSVLAQRLARRGWRVVALDAGPFWDPGPRLGERRTRARTTSTGPNRGSSPATTRRARRQQLRPRRRRFDGALRRLRAPLPSVGLPHAHRRRGRRRLADRLRGSARPTTSDSRTSCRSRARTGRGATRTATRTRPIRSAATAWCSSAAARALGIDVRVGPVAITNGRFGNRPHCIYRGFCLQGCKVNAKASPLITHIPDALAHGAEIRADCMVSRVVVDARRPRDAASPTSATASSIANGPASSPSPATRSRRRGCCSTRPARGFPTASATTSTSSAATSWCRARPRPPGRYDEEVRAYKAPPPEVSTEAFYETDPTQAYRRGFSSRCVSPLPITYAEHVAAQGHWGAVLREYMRDYVHWADLRRAVRVPAPGRQPRHPGRRDRPPRPAGRPVLLQPVRQRPALVDAARRSWRTSIAAAGADEVDHHQPLRPPGRRLPHGRRPSAGRRRRATCAASPSPTSTSPTAACCRPRAAPTRR